MCSHIYQNGELEALMIHSRSLAIFPINKPHTKSQPNKTGHVILTIPIRGYSVIWRLALDIFHLHTKFVASRFSCSGDMIAGVDWKWIIWPWPRLFSGGLSPKTYNLIQSSCMQNLMILALAVPQISLEALKFKVGHMTLATPLLRVIGHSYAGTWHTAYLCTKFDDCSLSRSSDVNNWCQPKFKLFTWHDHAPFRDGLPSAG